MKILALSITMALTSFAAQASGIPAPLKELVLRQAEIAGRQVGDLKAGDSGCADFSGHWVGSCTSGSDTKKVDITIAQSNCDSLRVQNEDADTSGSALGAISAKDLFASADWAVRLGDDRKSVTLQAGFSVNSLKLAAPLGGRLSIVTTRNADTLNVKGLVNTWLALQDVSREEFECSLQKQ
jgi:hypothetical protein